MNPPGEPGFPAMSKYVPRPGAYPYSIEYPTGWHVDDAQANTVVFYQDDETEGTAFTLVVSGLQGELSAQQVLQALGQFVQQQYPDIQIRVLSARNVPMAGSAVSQLVDAEATWTGRRQQAMRAVIQVRTLTVTGTGFTSFVYLGGQAPAPAFDALRPVYVRMIKTFTI